MSHSEIINELAAALSKAQGEMQAAIKDKVNPFFKSSYADLGSVWDAARPVLSKYGLCVMQTTEITGDGQKVNGLRYKDRATQTEHNVILEGVFVQIGLVPNTEFLKGTIELSKFGEIIIDDKCHTNLPGVFAAGDVTTVPYKQIVIAAGEGSKAALSAFDYLIRTPEPTKVKETASV